MAVNFLTNLIIVPSVHKTNELEFIPTPFHMPF